MRKNVAKESWKDHDPTPPNRSEMHPIHKTVKHPNRYKLQTYPLKGYKGDTENQTFINKYCLIFRRIFFKFTGVHIKNKLCQY